MTQVLILTVAIFAIGGVLILAATQIPGLKPVARELWPFYRSEFLIVGAVLLPSALGSWAFRAFLFVLVLRGLWELFALFRHAANAFLKILAAGSLLLLVSVLTGVLRDGQQGFLWLLLAQAAVETNDAFGLLIGKLIGRTRIFPRLSPGKTLAGLVGGLTAGLAAGLAVAMLLLHLPLTAAFAVTVTMLAAGLAGDLLLSALKRRLGVKDFPPVALLHGGLLDIYDSLLFAAPALLLLRSLLKL